MKKVDLSKVLKAIDDEPEYPGEIPDSLKNALLDAMKRQDLEFLIFVLRRTVSLTKTGIKKRILEE